jgi:hypothetical protein
MLKTHTLIHVKLHHITHSAESGRRGDHAQLDAIPLANWFTNTDNYGITCVYGAVRENT